MPPAMNAAYYNFIIYSALVARKLKIEYITEFLLLACYIFTVPYLGPFCYSPHIFWFLLILLSVVTLLEILGALDYFFLLKKWGNKFFSTEDMF